MLQTSESGSRLSSNLMLADHAFSLSLSGFGLPPPLVARRDPAANQKAGARELFESAARVDRALGRPVPIKRPRANRRSATCALRSSGTCLRRGHFVASLAANFAVTDERRRANGSERASERGQKSSSPVAAQFAPLLRLSPPMVHRARALKDTR